MIILSLSIGEISSACLIIDGKVVFASYEDRFHNRKCISGYPKKAIEYILKKLNLKKKQIDKVVIVNVTESNLDKSVVNRLEKFSTNDFVEEQDKYYFPILFKKKKINYISCFKKKIDKSIYPKDILSKLIKEGETLKNSKKIRKKIVINHLKINPSKIHFVEHHFAHAAYGYLSTNINFKKTMIFTADSWGDYSNSNVYNFEKGAVKHIFSSGKQNLGRLYRNITLLMGMKPYQHEYKVMGLAPYAKRKFAVEVKNIFERYLYNFDGDWKFKKKPKDNYFTFKKLLEGYRFDNIASGLQLYLESRLLEWFEYFIKRNKNTKNIVFSGGLSMNVKANMLISQLCKKNKINFYPAPSGDDYSNCISAGYIETKKGAQKLTEFAKPNIIKNLYLGYEFTKFDEEKVVQWSKKNGFRVYLKNKQLITDSLSKGKILALCIGKAEFGARALGNRSIIADPRDFSIIKKINIAVKNRDFWMPFATTVLQGHEKLYFKNIDIKANRFMENSVNTTNFGKKNLSAAIHPYDNTSRPQVLEKNTNKDFYELIKNFGKKTGVYALLNTSLNIHGFPMVNDSKDMIFVLKNTLIDGLITSKYFLINNKKKN